MSKVKHFNVAALAAVLVPLSLAAAPAAAQGSCPGGVVTGFVWNDANNNGIQDNGETGIPETPVTLSLGEGVAVTQTDSTGHYLLCLPYEAGWEVVVDVPSGFTQGSPANVGSDSLDSDGDNFIDGQPPQVSTFITPGGVYDFGFWTPTPTTSQPGTGTPGYWKNHPEAWPVASIKVGNITYTKNQAIALLNDPGSDKSLTMFSSLLPAMLNVLIGNNHSCVDDTIAQANIWMGQFPAGSKVKASSAAWKVGEPMHRVMDNYNNGVLCAPHRD